MITLTILHDYVVLLDDEDYERISKFSWSTDKAGCVRRQYRKIRSSKTRTIPIANEVMQKFDCIFDHKDRDTFNNQKNNLREATRLDNARNKTKMSGTSSKYNGVSWHNRDEHWRAQISVNKIRKFLGSFETEIGAARAYNRAAMNFFKEFANLNKDENGNILC